MADHHVQENNLGRIVLPKTAGQTVPAATYARFQNVGTLKTYLLANGYTAQRLNQMTYNDLVYAAKQKSGITP